MAQPRNDVLDIVREYLLARVQRRLQTTATGCRVWPGATRYGYGVMFAAGESWLVHRLVWMLNNGPIPDGFVVCHSCDNPPCAELSHLWLGTHDDNMADAGAKGRISNQNKGRTECRRGHAFTPENTRVGKRGDRSCKTCIAERDHRRRSEAAACR